jgi:transglutaminase-like putative cysteine protease
LQIRIGFELRFELPQPTPMVLMLSVHPSRQHDLVQAERLAADRPASFSEYRDSYGNRCTRTLLPAGAVAVTSDAIIHDPGLPDQAAPHAVQHAVQDLPAETLLFLLPSRYCESDLLSETAWRLFGNAPMGWGRVKAICDFVHGHLTFGYPFARNTRTAWEGFNERQGVCRDFAHLAITLCRCMNIPARYCTGFLGDIGVPVDPNPMDFSGWFEAYLGGRWHTFDARHAKPRIGRIPLAYGRDAADVAITTSFGPHVLTGFRVWTDELHH